VDNLILKKNRRLIWTESANGLEECAKNVCAVVKKKIKVKKMLFNNRKYLRRIKDRF
jgi:hypothetical protein